MMTDSQLHIHRQSHDKQNSWWMKDARGIELCRVCDTCLAAAQALYPPEVLGLSGRYEDVVEDPIEEPS